MEKEEGADRGREGAQCWHFDSQSASCIRVVQVSLHHLFTTCLRNQFIPLWLRHTQGKPTTDTHCRARGWQDMEDHFLSAIEPGGDMVCVR